MQPKYLFFPKLIGLVFIFAICSCNENTKKTDRQSTVHVINTPVITEDSITSQIRPVLVIHETNEIQMGGYIINSLDVDSIRYQKISMKDYYLTMKAELKSELHLSTNKEKTEKAIALMGQMAAKADTAATAYKVYFHLNATAGKTVYNEGHTKYLDKDFKELKRNFTNIQ